MTVLRTVLWLPIPTTTLLFYVLSLLSWFLACIFWKKSNTSEQWPARVKRVTHMCNARWAAFLISTSSSQSINPRSKRGRGRRKIKRIPTKARKNLSMLCLSPSPISEQQQLKPKLTFPSLWLPKQPLKKPKQVSIRHATTTKHHSYFFRKSASFIRGRRWYCQNYQAKWCFSSCEPHSPVFRAPCRHWGAGWEHFSFYLCVRAMQEKRDGISLSHTHTHTHKRSCVCEQVQKAGECLSSLSALALRRCRLR